jgi:hypothetical protein
MSKFLTIVVSQFPNPQISSQIVTVSETVKSGSGHNNFWVIREECRQTIVHRPHFGHPLHFITSSYVHQPFPSGLHEWTNDFTTYIGRTSLSDNFGGFGGFEDFVSGIWRGFRMRSFSPRLFLSVKEERGRKICGKRWIYYFLFSWYYSYSSSSISAVNRAAAFII